MRRPALLAALLAATAGVLLRRREAARRAECELWAEAAIPRDLR